MHEHGSATGPSPATSHDSTPTAGPALDAAAAPSVGPLPRRASADGRSGSGGLAIAIAIVSRCPRARRR
ncbi:hypothetical protein [Streptomyces sp. BA2]|uniref:hypothetical protein n=1 Tax=Streptomyces sp. BA2 TaxID=436595 RepID=UPI0013239D76|nr:hypothetical protein [Streptomyces sp. BA2]MWA09944.1 hypothetical protein [Streptomyces sp. BA2]